MRPPTRLVDAGLVEERGVQIPCFPWFRPTLAMMSLWSCALAAAPVEVRYAEGVTHGFLQLRTADDVLIASGDLLQVARGGEVESRMVFQFKDGSLFDETVVYTQQRVFAMRSFHLIQRGPAFGEDTEIRLQGASGKYTVNTSSHQGGGSETLEGAVNFRRMSTTACWPRSRRTFPRGAMRAFT